jgi:hypothetical protein
MQDWPITVRAGTAKRAMPKYESDRGHRCPAIPGRAFNLTLPPVGEPDAPVTEINASGNATPDRFPFTFAQETRSNALFDRLFTTAAVTPGADNANLGTNDSLLPSCWSYA